MGSESVTVVVRCRPLNARERALGSDVVLSVDPRRCQCSIEKPGAADEPPKHFTFDGTYFLDQTTEQMYNEAAYSLVEVSSVDLSECLAVQRGRAGPPDASGSNACLKSEVNPFVAALPSLQGVTEGYNGTIFAYGQTGSGKSFTMQGVSHPAAQRGVIPRAFEHIFESIQVKS